MSEIRWRKSKHSDVNGDCVELTATLDAVRDSKDPHGPVLRADIRKLVHAVKVGRFNR